MKIVKMTRVMTKMMKTVLRKRLPIQVMKVMRRSLSRKMIMRPTSLI